mmetsp:Transcript_16781/g.53082  ORF Transcript_16781/g.53082 Transcript_16781/m.53082 type:complete len:284 (-) Transcript_16781:3043-3894(-)
MATLCLGGAWKKLGVSLSLVCTSGWNTARYRSAPGTSMTSSVSSDPVAPTRASAAAAESKSRDIEGRSPDTSCELLGTGDGGDFLLKLVRLRREPARDAMGPAGATEADGRGPGADMWCRPRCTMSRSRATSGTAYLSDVKATPLRSSSMFMAASVSPDMMMCPPLGTSATILATLSTFPPYPTCFCPVWMLPCPDPRGAIPVCSPMRTRSPRNNACPAPHTFPPVAYSAPTFETSGRPTSDLSGVGSRELPKSCDPSPPNGPLASRFIELPALSTLDANFPL